MHDVAKVPMSFTFEVSYLVISQFTNCLLAIQSKSSYIISKCRYMGTYRPLPKTASECSIRLIKSHLMYVETFNCASSLSCYLNYKDLSCYLNYKDYLITVYFGETECNQQMVHGISYAFSGRTRQA